MKCPFRKTKTWQATDTRCPGTIVTVIKSEETETFSNCMKGECPAYENENEKEICTLCKAK